MADIFGTIRSVEDWYKIAPPKEGKKHLKDGRSAKELAKAWFPKPGEAERIKEEKERLANIPKYDSGGYRILSGSGEKTQFEISSDRPTMHDVNLQKLASEDSEDDGIRGASMSTESHKPIPCTDPEPGYIPFFDNVCMVCYELL